MFAPLRNFECRDGFFVQYIQCTVVLLFGTGIHIVRGLPPFNLLASLGGVLYSLGNLFSVPIVKGIGIGLGMLIWGSTQIVTGWCVAHFGLFGTKKQTVSNEPMNYAGLAITILSGVMFIFVKTDEESAEHERGAEPTLPEFDVPSKAESVKLSTMSEAASVTPGEGKRRFKLPAISPKKVTCVLMSMTLGALHALMTTPIIYVQNNQKNASQNVLDYVFSHFVGIFVTTTLIFFCYTIYKRGKPFVDGRLVIPSGLFGILWSLGMVLFFVSNDHITQTITYPITGRLPAIIGALVDVFIFKSIKGTKNLIFLTISVSIGVLGVILVSLSNG
uniref:Transmembrane protein 144 n=1 Tax=Panagrellus redivivus TaxID=6233 RepID=A0A7E4VKV9_PANRE